MGTQKEMLWTFLGLWACLLCKPGLAAAIPIATEWPPTEADDFMTTYYPSPQGTSSDYFEPTMGTTTFMIQSTVPPGAAGGTLEGNPSTVREANLPRPSEEETQNSVLASNADYTPEALNQVEITPPGEEMEEAQEVRGVEKEGLAEGNSSNASSEKGTIQTAPAVSEEAATLSVLGSAEVPATFLNEWPEATELLTDTYAGVTDSSLVPASASWEKANNTGLSEKILDTATEETNADSELNPTLASWEDITDATAEPKEETSQPFPDASSKAVAPSSIPPTPSSNTEELPVEEPRATPASDEHSVPPASGDDTAVETPTPSFRLRPPVLLPSSDTSSGSSESSESAIQPSPGSKDNLGAEPAIVEGRGDSDSSVPVPVPDSDAELTIIPSLGNPEVGPEGSGDVTPEELGDLIAAEVSSSFPAGGTTDLLPGMVSPSRSPSRPSEVDLDATAASSVGLSMAPGYSSLLPEDDEIQTVSVTKEEAEEGSGTRTGNEIPFTLASPQQGQTPETPEGHISATEARKGDVSADLESGTASPLNPGEETASPQLAENGQPAVFGDTGTQNEIISSPSEITPINSAEASGEEPKGLSDVEVTSSSALDDETALTDQGASGVTTFLPSQSSLPSEREGGGDSFSAAPGNGSSLSEGSMVVPDSGVANGEGEGRTDFPPSDAELAPVAGTQLPVEGSELLEDGEFSSPPPAENTAASESDAIEAPSNGSPGSPGSSQPEGNTQAGSVATEGSNGTQLPVGGPELLEDEESSSPSPVDNPVVSESDAGEAPSNGSPGSLGSSQPEGNRQADSIATEGSEEPEGSAAAMNGEEAFSVTLTTDTGSAIEGATFSGTNGEALPSGDNLVGAAPESEVNKGTISETSNDLNEINTLPSEQRLDSEKEMETNPGDFADLADGGSGDSSPFTADSETSTKAGGLSGKPSSSTLLDGTSSGSFISEAEEGEGSPSPLFRDLGSSPLGSEVPGGTWGGEGSSGLLTDEGAVTSSGENQTGADISDAGPGSPEGTQLPVEHSGALASGEVSGQPLLKEGETSATTTSSGKEFLPASASSEKGGETSETNVASGEGSLSGLGKKVISFLVSKLSTQPSTSSKTPDSYQPSTEDARKSGPAASEVESPELEDSSSVAGKEAYLDPSPTESETHLPSTDRLGSVGLSLENGEEPQLSPNDTASMDAEQSEDSSNVKEEEPSIAPSAIVSQAAFNGVETNGLSVTGNEGSQLSPDDMLNVGSESVSEVGEEPEDISVISGMKSSSTEGVETSISEATAGPQPSPDGATKVGTVAGLGAFDEVEQWEGSSPVNEKETPTGLSSTASPGTSGDEDVSGGLGKGRPFLSAERVEAATSESPDSKGFQPSLNGATVGPGDSDGVKIPEGSSSVSGEGASLVPLNAESRLISPTEEGVEIAGTGSANSGGSQPSPDGAEGEQPGSSSSVSGKEASLAPAATEAQPGSSSPDGVKNYGLSTSGSSASTSEGAQLPPDYVARAGSEAGEESEDVSDMSGKKSSLAVSATRSPLSPLSKEGAETLGLGSYLGSQPSSDVRTIAAGPGVSGEVEQWGSSSAVGEDGSPVTKSPGASLGEGPANNVEFKAYGAASDGAAASGKGEESEDIPTTKEKKLLLSPSDTKSQSPGTPPGEDASGGLSEGESFFLTPGLDSMGTKSTSSSETGLSPENIAEHLGDKSGPMNGGEPFIQSLPAADGSRVTVSYKASGETLLSDSISPDGTVAIQGTPGQILGITDSSLPSSEIGDIGDKMASPGGAANSLLTLSGQPALSSSDVLRGSDSSSPVAKADSEGLAGGLGSGTVVSSSAGTSLQSSGSGGTKMAIDQQPGTASSLSTSFSSSDTQLFGSSSSGLESTGKVAGEPSSQSQAEDGISTAKETGKMDSFPSDLEIQDVGPSPSGLASSSDEASLGNTKDLSPTTSEGRGDTDSSVLTAGKGTSPKSGEAHPSLSGTQLHPAMTPQLPAVESGPEVNAGISPQSPKAEVTEDAEHTLSGKPSASSSTSSSTFSGSEGTKSGSSTSTSVVSLPDSSVQSEGAAGVSKDTLGGTKASSTDKSDAPPAVLGVGGGAAKSSQTTSKKEDGKMSDKKEDSKKLDKEEDGKKSSKEEDSKKPDKKKDSQKPDKKEEGKKSDKKDDSKKSDKKEDSKKSNNKPDSSSQNSKQATTANENSAALNPVPAGSLSGVRGLWNYKLESRIRMNYGQRCLDWLSHEREPAAWNQQLPSCPCSLQQGLSDGRFTRSKKGFLDSRFTMLYSSLPNKYGAGIRCLYKNSNGQFVEGHQERIWRGSRRNSSYNDEELKLYDWCCNQAGKGQFCDKYHQKRPKIGCDGYRRPVQVISSEEEPDSNERD